MPIRLQERFNISKENINKIPLKENLEIVEKDGQSYKCRTAYEIPVWRLDEKNLNNRVYSKKLAENIIENSPTTLGLANHPKDEADVTNTFAVERNPHIKEGVFYVDAYFVGQHGELAKEIIEAGGEVGLSSSALGDVDDDGNVMVEGFQIERYADWVDNPSYQVFVGKNGSLEAKAKKTEEIKESNTNIKDTIKTTTNTVVNKEEEKRTMSDKSKTLSIEEKNLRLGVKNLFEKAESKEDLQEKVNAYKEVLDYCDGVDIAEDYVKEASSKIQEIQGEIYELANKGKELDNIKESSEKSLTELKEENSKIKEDLETMTEKYDRAIELLENMKEREKKIKELYEVAIAEKNGMVEASEYKELQVYSESQDKEIEELKEEVVKLKKRIRGIMERKLEKGRSIDEEDDKKKDDDEDEEMEPEDEKGDVKDDDEEKKESHAYDFGNNVEVELYYEDLVSRNPRVKEIKKDILGSKTLFEAQKKYFNLRDLIEEDILPPKYKTVNLKEDTNREPRQRGQKLNVREGWM